MEMAAMGMELVASWGTEALTQRLAQVTRKIANGLAGLGVQILDERLRAPHILSLGFPRGVPEGLFQSLAAEQIYVAPRLGRMRIAPHVYNNDADIERFIAVIRQSLRARI